MLVPHKIAVIKGDLNGITVTDSALLVQGALDDAGAMKRPLDTSFFNYNADNFNKWRIERLGQRELDGLRGYDAIFLGAVGDETKIPNGVLEKGILLEVRQKFDQAVNLRPVILPEGAHSILVGKDHNDINFEICRENTEGLYVRIGRVENPGTDDEVGIQEMRCSYRGVKRLVDFAIERAKKRKKPGLEKPRVHIVFKTNVLTEAASPWNRVIKEYQERNDVDVRYMHIDNFAMQMVSHPEQFDVVATENMFGDITTDLGAMIAGGIGTGVSGNINLTGEFPSLFEPIHGSAPDKWYERDEKGRYIPGTHRPDLVQRVRPEGAMLSWSMMLRHLGEERAATLVEEAARTNIRGPTYEKRPLDRLTEDACKFIRSRAV